jgi:hypothetical protein
MQKYQRVFDAIEEYGAKVHDVRLEDSAKPYRQATAPSELIKNRIWDAIKQSDSTYSDLRRDRCETRRPDIYLSNSVTVFQNSQILL